MIQKRTLILAAVLMTPFHPTRVMARELLAMREPESRWALTALPSNGAPIEAVGNQLNAPVEVITSKPSKKIMLLRSPADARWARMAAQQMHLGLSSAGETLYFPNPDELPLNVKN